MSLYMHLLMNTNYFHILAVVDNAERVENYQGQGG